MQGNRKLNCSRDLGRDFYQTYACITGNQGFAQIFLGPFLALNTGKQAENHQRGLFLFLRQSRVARNSGDSPFRATIAVATVAFSFRTVQNHCRLVEPPKVFCTRRLNAPACMLIRDNVSIADKVLSRSGQDGHTPSHAPVDLASLAQEGLP